MMTPAQIRAEIKKWEGRPKSQERRKRLRLLRWALENEIPVVRIKKS